jgi:hypothetical protein
MIKSAARSAARNADGSPAFVRKAEVETADALPAGQSMLPWQRLAARR